MSDATVVLGRHVDGEYAAWLGAHSGGGVVSGIKRAMCAYHKESRCE